MESKNRLLALLLAVTLFMLVLVGCSSRDAEEEPSEPESSQEEEEQKPEEGTLAEFMSDYRELVDEKKWENEDSIGWLQVPYTTIDDVVVFYDKNNSYYLHRDFYGDYNRNGVFYADYRTDFGDGTSSTLGSNICIYGHALTENPESDKYDIRFAPLHDFRDEELAREIPYIFFSTAQENMAFEVFAVFIANSDNTAIPYNRGDLPRDEFLQIVQEEVLPRSLYNYDVELSEEDTFLTLSTCIYYLPDGTPTNYPNTYYRFAIMAKLVDSNEPMKEEASFTVNEDPVIDPPGKMNV